MVMQAANAEEEDDAEDDYAQDDSPFGYRKYGHCSDCRSLAGVRGIRSFSAECSPDGYENPSRHVFGNLNHDD